MVASLPLPGKQKGLTCCAVVYWQVSLFSLLSLSLSLSALLCVVWWQLAIMGPTGSGKPLSPSSPQSKLWCVVGGHCICCCVFSWPQQHHTTTQHLFTGHCGTIMREKKRKWLLGAKMSECQYGCVWSPKNEAVAENEKSLKFLYKSTIIRLFQGDCQSGLFARIPDIPQLSFHCSLSPLLARKHLKPTVTMPRLMANHASLSLSLSPQKLKSDRLTLFNHCILGKTTLLNILARRVKTGVTGEVLVNGIKPTRRMRRVTAYVLQDDIFFSNLTVRETLTCNAYLKLPHKLTFAEKRERVEEVITELGVSRAANTIIGGHFVVRWILCCHALFIVDLASIILSHLLERNIWWWKKENKHSKRALDQSVLNFSGRANYRYTKWKWEQIHSDFLHQQIVNGLGLDSHTALGLIVTMRNLAQR